MMRFLKVVYLIALALLITSCVRFNLPNRPEGPSGIYSGPLELTPPNLNPVVERTFSDVWDDLLGVATSELFAIIALEKESGLIVLNFAHPDTEIYIDCGRMEYRAGSLSFYGSYVQFQKERLRAIFDGQLTILVSKVDSATTSINVRANYNIRVPPDALGRIESWSFISGGLDEVYVQNPITGTQPSRTCLPTHAAERTILKAVQ